MKYLFLNLPFPNKTYLHKQILNQDNRFDFTIYDALIVISSERLIIFHTLLCENQFKLENFINRNKITNFNTSYAEKIKNYFLIRKMINQIYCNIHIIILIIDCVCEGILISKHHKYFQFNIQKTIFKRFLEIMVYI